MAQKVNAETVNRKDNNLEQTGKTQCAVVATFLSERQFRELKGIAVNCNTQQSQVVGGSQLHQKPTIKERVSAYNQAQTNSLHLNLLDLGVRFTKVSGTINGDKVSCFIVYNDNPISTTEWQTHIEHIAHKYNHVAFIVECLESH